MTDTLAAASVAATPEPKGMTVKRRFTTPGVHPFDTVEWELRDARIGHGDKVAFEQKGVEFPTTWSQNSTNIVAQKYFRGQLDSPARERSVKQMISRVANTITEWGHEHGYFATQEDGDAFQDELTYFLLHQMAAFNSPVWFNVGFEDQPQCSACFILSVDDTLDSILDWNTKEGKIFRGGSGSGINLSNIRGSVEPLSKGGTASGPVSFMRGTDSWAGTIKSGGKTRRAAKMVILDIDHPDVGEFIWCKAKEEDKAEALRDAGFDMSIDGEGFKSIQYQNANNSVRVSDEFMRAVEADETWVLKARADGLPVGEPIPARELMRDIAKAAWRCADPGVQYDTVINQWHTCPKSGRINASNPCSEYMHVDNSACNLASLNLMKFRQPDGTLDVAAYEHAIDIVFMAQEILVGPSSYPTDEIGINARAFRQLGMGYTNLGAYLMADGTPYDSDAARGTAAALAALMTGRAYRQSAMMADAVGPYERYQLNHEGHMGVMQMHRDAAHELPDSGVADTALHMAARNAWDDVVELGNEYGFRNAQATVLAPTGTISFLMDCDTTGVEPDFSLVKFKELVGGGQMTIVNQTIPSALANLGYTPEQVEAIKDYIEEPIPVGEPVDGVQLMQARGTIVGAPGISKEDLPVFDVAVGERAIAPMGHIKMMGAVQPFISGAISKTVNMPASSTVEDIYDAYMDSWKLGVKALAIYRDGSKTAQALRTDAQLGQDGAADEPLFTQAQVDELITKANGSIGPLRRKMPRERQSLTHKFTIGGHEGYITAGKYEDGTLGEIFLTDIGKEGSTMRGMMNSFATMVSIALQYGVPLETLARKFSYVRFEPEGITQNIEIPFAKSMPDYIMRWLASRFLDPSIQLELGIRTPAAEALKADQEAATSVLETAAPVVKTPAKPPGAELGPQGSITHTAAAEGNGNGVHQPVMTQHNVQLDAGPPCKICGGMTQRSGVCYVCSQCGATTGCS